MSEAFAKTVDALDEAVAKAIAEDESDEIVLACQPITVEPVVPSMCTSCAGCGSLIWVSARISRAMGDRGKTLCFACGLGGENAKMN